MTKQQREVPCHLCHRWVADLVRHNLGHIRENPHAFCHTIRCDNGTDCPVR